MKIKMQQYFVRALLMQPIHDRVFPPPLRVLRCACIGVPTKHDLCQEQSPGVARHQGLWRTAATLIGPRHACRLMFWKLGVPD